jgi:hypothetical protein
MKLNYMDLINEDLNRVSIVLFAIIMFWRGVFVMKKDILNTIKEVKILISHKNVEGLTIKLNHEEAFKVATLIRLLEKEEQIMGFSVLSKDNASAVLNYLDLQTRLEVLKNLTHEKAGIGLDSVEGNYRNQMAHGIQVDVA